MQRRSWAGAGWLATIGVGLLVAFVNFYVGMFVVALALVGAALLLIPLRVVPVESAEGYIMVLTSEGYKLINDAGQIVYTLK